MLHQHGLNLGLSTIPLITNAKTRSISPENPEGLPGNGGRTASVLGVARKGRPCIEIPQGERATIADIQGAGIIQSIWITVPDRTDHGYFILRDLVVRMYWDDEETPSVECPLGDFFCNGFGTRAVVNSLPIVVNPTGGMNCYFPMPFRKAAKITIENEHAVNVGGIFYQINYTLVDELPPETGYFHAQWRRDKAALGQDYVILDGVQGKGHFVGTYMAWASLGRYWWGEGEVKFYMDEDEEWPTVCGTGTEDYFGGAWCFYETKDNLITETTYSTPYLGYPFYSKTDHTRRDHFGEDAVPMHGMYRWHLMDPVRFEQRLKVTVQQIGHNSMRLFERSDDISSVAYWYQTEPHAVQPEIMPADKRWPL